MKFGLETSETFETGAAPAVCIPTRRVAALVAQMVRTRSLCRMTEKPPKLGLVDTCVNSRSQQFLLPARSTLAHEVCRKVQVQPEPRVRLSAIGVHRSA